MVNPLDERKLEDIRKLALLAERSSGRLRMLSSSSSNPNTVELSSDYVTAYNDRYPNERQSGIGLRISLSGDYPFRAPDVSVTTPIFHPHVFTSSAVCLGRKWLPSDTLDVLAQRVLRLLVFEPTNINLDDAANSSAKDWYREAVRRYPAAFPTDTIRFDSALPARRQRRMQQIGSTSSGQSPTATPTRSRRRDWGAND